MADENVAIMQRAYDAFNAADIDTLTELFDEDVVWPVPGRSSMPTTPRAATRLSPTSARSGRGRGAPSSRATAIVRRR